jgi:hypothetical protein
MHTHRAQQHHKQQQEFHTLQKANQQLHPAVESLTDTASGQKNDSANVNSRSTHSDIATACGYAQSSKNTQWSLMPTSQRPAQLIALHDPSWLPILLWQQFQAKQARMVYLGNIPIHCPLYNILP